MGDQEDQFPQTNDEAVNFAAELQDKVEQLQEELFQLEEENRTLRGELVQAEQQSTPVAGDEELRALANTVRAAQRNGHPDAQKHLDTLLRALGAR